MTLTYVICRLCISCQCRLSGFQPSAHSSADHWPTIGFVFLRKQCCIQPAFRHTAGTCCTGHSNQGKKLRCEDVTIIYQVAFMALRCELEEREVDQENVESFPTAELMGRRNTWCAGLWNEKYCHTATPDGSVATYVVKWSCELWSCEPMNQWPMIQPPTITIFIFMLFSVNSLSRLTTPSWSLAFVRLGFNRFLGHKYYIDQEIFDPLFYGMPVSRRRLYIKLWLGLETDSDSVCFQFLIAVWCSVQR